MRSSIFAIFFQTLSCVHKSNFTTLFMHSALTSEKSKFMYVDLADFADPRLVSLPFCTSFDCDRTHGSGRVLRQCAGFLAGSLRTLLTSHLEPLGAADAPGGRFTSEAPEDVNAEDETTESWNLV